MGSEIAPRETVSTEVRAGAYPAVIIGVWFFRLFFPIATVLLLIVWGPILLDMIVGRRQLEPFSMVAVPLVIVFFVYLSLLIARKSQRMTRPDIFDAEGSEQLGVRLSWDSVSRIHLNPGLAYVTVLFKGLERPGPSAGFVQGKKRFEPSLDAFLSLVRRLGVPIEETMQVTIRDLFEIKENRLKERGLAGDDF